MLMRFCPRQVAHSLASIDLEALQQLGIKGIILDLDNTLVYWNSAEYGKGNKAWLARAQKLGFDLCILSNSTTNRVRSIATGLGLPWVAKAFKPLLFSYRRALNLLQTEPQATAIIGDQILTDIWGGIV